MLGGGLRQSILLAPLAMHVDELRMVLPSGDVIGKRPLDEFVRILRYYGIEMEFGQYCLHIMNRAEGDRKIVQRQRLNVASTGVTFVAISAAVNIGFDAYEIDGASRDPEVKEVLDCIGATFTYDAQSLIIFSPVFNVNITSVPLDRIAIAELIIISQLHDVLSLTDFVRNEIEQRIGPDFIPVLKWLKGDGCPDQEIFLPTLLCCIFLLT